MAPKAENASRRVLVVEDEYFLATEVARALDQKGIATVGPARNIREALDMVESEQIDAAILDINLHNQTVFPLAEELEARKVPFVFATGYGEQAIPARFRDVPRFEKPLDLESLANAVSRG